MKLTHVQEINDGQFVHTYTHVLVSVGENSNNMPSWSLAARVTAKFLIWFQKYNWPYRTRPEKATA